MNQKIEKTLESIASHLEAITKKMENGIVVVVAANTPPVPIKIDRDSPTLDVEIINSEGLDVRVSGSVFTDNASS